MNMHPSAQEKSLDDTCLAEDYRPPITGQSELMKDRVQNILLVSSLYDAFILEEDGLLADQISGEYRELSLSTSPPIITRTDTCEDALNELKRKRYDIVITMPRIVDREPFEFGREAKKIQRGIPVILLLTDTAEIPIYHKPGQHDNIDKVFYWNGNSSLMFAITKYVEDLINTERDAKNSFVRVLLIVEDSPRYYSIFLPILYREIMMQTHALIAEDLNEQMKTFRKTARPKIIMAETFEEAMEKYEHYRENILGVITDVTYNLGGQEDEDAGFRLVQELDDSIPVLIHSSNTAHEAKAESLGIPFIGKQSDRLLHDLGKFFKQHLGFGDFVFRNSKGEVLGRASDLQEFIQLLEIVPTDSMIFHANSNHFSNWLMARGEIDLALKLRPKKVSDFKSEEEVRLYLTNTFRELDRAKRRGIITDFAQQNFDVDETFTRLGGGSLGGKGRGLAFLFALFAQRRIDSMIPDCQIRIPDTLVIGTEMFDRFMEENNVVALLNPDMPDDEIKSIFMKCQIPGDLCQSLGKYLKHVTEPLAVRSSSLLEDSQNQPFAGIYSTYMLPNNSKDDYARLQQLCDAIKLVYASAFFKSARAYIQSTVHTSEEEKMAIVLQKMVGNIYNNKFYPVYSGVAQSYNFYPVEPLKREDGIVSVALGLGNIVVDGGKVLSVSPNHPEIVLNFSTPEEVMKNSQNEFFALDMSVDTHDLLKGEHVTLAAQAIQKAEPDGTLDYIASTFDINDSRLMDGASGKGPKLITFAGVLKYKMLPMLDIIKPLLDIGSRGMGGHVEMEFAMRFDESGKPEFYVVQIRPLTSIKERVKVTIDPTSIDGSLIFSSRAMGNGSLQGIRDIVFIDPAKFDNTQTHGIAREIDAVNASLKDTPYLLIGPGRWGTRDRFLGIPVTWDNISQARAMVEAELENFRIDPSHGTHFFHNITSLGILYFNVRYGTKDNVIRWDRFTEHKAKYEGKFVTHVELPYELDIMVDGRTGRGIIKRKENNSPAGRAGD
ncbi:MAG: PEP/pyruvate-binding domain-containing protein [Thermoplasmata archaeon]